MGVCNQMMMDICWRKTWQNQVSGVCVCVCVSVCVSYFFLNEDEPLAKSTKFRGELRKISQKSFVVWNHDNSSWLPSGNTAVHVFDLTKASSCGDKVLSVNNKQSDSCHRSEDGRPNKINSFVPASSFRKKQKTKKINYVSLIVHKTHLRLHHTCKPLCMESTRWILIAVGWVSFQRKFQAIASTSGQSGLNFMRIAKIQWEYRETPTRLDVNETISNGIN